MSDDVAAPAVALIELSSVAAGIVTGDAMVKASPVASILAGTAHPGKYLVLVSGDTASVEVALQMGLTIGGEAILDTLFLPNVAPSVVTALRAVAEPASMIGDALGIVETATVAASIEGADAGVKAAHVTLEAIRLADGLGGKGYVLFTGVVAEVEVAVEAAVARTEPHGGLVAHRVVAQLHPEMADNLRSDLRFRARLGER